MEYNEYRKDCIKKIIEKSNIANDINNIIFKINNNSEFYLDSEKIKADLDNMIINVLENNLGSYKNLCIECGEDMGIDNPRQLCCKTYCGNPPNKKHCNNCNNILKDNEKTSCNRIECIKDRCHC